MQPFRIQIPQQDLDELEHRIGSTRWPDGLGGWERGIPVGYVRELARYWCEEYDWRVAEAEINSYSQYLTEIDDATVHLLHVPSPEPGAIPLLLNHGWPGSFVEFLGVLGPLSDPRAHGLDPGIAFDLVIPSAPGFGFSQPLAEGWESVRLARAWPELMRRLGYDRYLVHGGDVGAVTSLEIGRADPEHVLGVHVNMLITYPPADPADGQQLSDEDRARLARLARFDAELSGYMKLQMTRPQSLAYGLTDSPVGQLAWIVERFRDWTGGDGLPEDAVDRDQMLTNVTLYWLTASAGPSAQIYYEGAKWMDRARAGLTPAPITVPVGVAVFREDILVPVRQLAEQQIPTITHWSEFDRGGHFAAMEKPMELVQDIRDFTASLAREKYARKAA